MLTVIVKNLVASVSIKPKFLTLRQHVTVYTHQLTLLVLKSKYHTRTRSIKLLSIQWLLLPPIHLLPLDWQNRPLFSTRNDLMCLHHLSAKEWYKYILPFPYNNVANKGLLLWRVMDAYASSCLCFKYHPGINRHNLGKMIWSDWCLNQKFMSLLTHIISTKWNEQIVFYKKNKNASLCYSNGM